MLIAVCTTRQRDRVAALRSECGASRQILRRVLDGRHVPVFGNALWLEVRFKALAARGDAGQALAILDRLNAKGTASP